MRKSVFLRLPPAGDQPQFDARTVACRKAPTVFAVTDEAVWVTCRVFALHIGPAAAVLEIVAPFLAHEPKNGDYPVAQCVKPPVSD